MLLTDIQIRKAKPKDKVYTLNDGNGLISSLLSVLNVNAVPV